jgi:hypothetical protein
MSISKRHITLKGEPYVNEVGVASGAQISPGHLVDGVATIALHTVAGGACPRALALAREEFGLGPDNSYQGLPAVSAQYVTNDTVKVGVFSPGMWALGRVASGANITINDRLESAGNGLFRKYNSGVILGRALETLNPAAEAFIRLEWM